jgi:F420-dependent oxidoreductase-like protein
VGFELATPQGYDIDALMLAIVAREVPGLDICVTVVPNFGRHPFDIAMQALTVQALTGNRLTLCVGLSQHMIVEGFVGMPYSGQVGQMREYLEVLMPLLHAGSLDSERDVIAARKTTPTIPGAVAPRVLVAAMGTEMLQVTGRLADGTSLWMVGPKTVADHIVPTITRAAEAAGRPRPEVQVGVPVCVTADPEAARARASAEFTFSPPQPLYGAMLDMDGGAGDVAVVGDEKSVAAQLRHYGETGATSIRVSVFGTSEETTRTYDLLASLTDTPTAARVSRSGT